MKEAPTYPDASKALTRMDRIKDSSTVTASKVVKWSKVAEVDLDIRSWDGFTPSIKIIFWVIQLVQLLKLDPKKLQIV